MPVISKEKNLWMVLAHKKGQGTNKFVVKAIDYVNALKTAKQTEVKGKIKIKAVKPLNAFIKF